MSLLTEVKAILKSLVLSCPENITVDCLNRDYRDVEGKFIPYRQLGYANLEQFLHSIPDTLRVSGSGPAAIVYFVPNEKSIHIHDMITKQKKPKPKTRSVSKVSSNKNNFSRGNNFTSNTQKRVPMRAQQLSPYESVNRNCMTRKVQLTTATPSTYTANPAATEVRSNQILYNLPQPNGITFNPQQYSNYEVNTASCIHNRMQNGVIKPMRNETQQYETQLGALLKKQCNVVNPLPLPHQEISQEKSQEKSVQIEKTAEKIVNEDKISTYKIKIPFTKDHSLPVNMSDEAESLLSMPKLRKENNPIVELTTQLDSDELQEGDSVQNINSESLSKSTKSKGFFDDSTESVESESEEAIPSFAAKSNVFFLDFPDQTVSYGNRIPPYKLPEEFKLGSYIKIFISEIHSPFRFWFNIHKENDELDLLMHRIEEFYTALDPGDLRIPVMCLSPGLVCAAFYNGLWHRAEIVAPIVNKRIKVSFMDYGTVTAVEIENIKFLMSSFAQLPAQALRGCLSHIKPRNFHWSHEATNYFLKLVEDLMLYGAITEIDKEENILYMIICDTNGDEVVQINTSLVEKRYACYNEEWKPEKIKQNNGKRVRHPREDFPT